ncbi:MAG: ABC transporter substrate-binding protein, partial [Albidovulum sp.]|uniref:LysM peptidoglycan-binding domain-containing protein n=1 Tax=Albidovulum sp. TaxID=1872424 RepID=UPI003CBBE79B
MLQRLTTVPRLVLGTAFALALPITAQAQEACTTYTVKAGDTLAGISFAAYGSYNYQTLFNANRDRLASNPNNMSEGMELALPCEDGRLSADQDLSSVIEEEEQKYQEARPQNNVYAPPLKFVTGNNWKPFADESLSGGGIFVKIATTALHRAGNDREQITSWVDDWGSHLDTLLPSGAFDVSIAWTKPDCDNMDVVS